MRHRGRERSLSARGRCADTTRPLHAETPAGTAPGSSIPLAWPDILSARPDCADPALRCPRKRGHSRELKERGMQHLRDAVGVLQRKATPEELEDYKRFVLNLAERVANAHREGGRAVSPAERAALEEIAASLDLPAP